MTMVKKRYAVIPPMSSHFGGEWAMVIENVNSDQQGRSDEHYPIMYRIVAKFPDYGEAINMATRWNKDQIEVEGWA